MHNLFKRFIQYAPLIALLSIALNIYFGLYSFHHDHRSVVRGILTEYPYIDIARGFVSQDDFIVNVDPLRKRMYALAQSYERGEVSIYIEFLNTGANIAVNPQSYIWPASLLKVPVAMAAMRKVEKGEWSLDTKLLLHEDDRDGQSGNVEHLAANAPVGSVFTVGELIKLTLEKSDNTAYRMLLREVGFSAMRDLHEAIGLEELISREGKISAKEYSRVLRSLYTASYLSRSSSQLILRCLDNAIFNEYISFPVDPAVPFPHKYGKDIDQRVYSDSGIVYLEHRPYLISVMVQGDPTADTATEERRATQFMRTVSKDAYEYFKNFK